MASLLTCAYFGKNLTWISNLKVIVRYFENALNCLSLLRVGGVGGWVGLVPLSQLCSKHLAGARRTGLA